jgi:hypothetical protein
MAGENVQEPIVRKVFASAIDLVVHCDLEDANRADPARGLRRQVMEIIAVVPSLHDDFSTEPIFAREHIGGPLEWTGILPPTADHIERALPPELTVRGLLESGSWPR